MSDYTLIGELPRHLYVWVDTAHTHRELQAPRWMPAVWYGLVSYPGRMWGCTVLLESGAVYRNLPPHALRMCEAEPDTEWTPQQAQTWDAYGWRYSVHEYSYLRGLECLVRCGPPGETQDLPGHYLFTIAAVADGFSAYPEQAKEFSFVHLQNGWLTVQPTNHLVFRERSFTGHDLAFPRGLKRQTEAWSCE